MSTLVVNRRALRLALTTLLAMAIACSALPALATTIVASPETTPEGQPFVTLDKRTVSVSALSAFSVSARIAVDVPTSYLESRLRIHNSDGRLIYQDTVVRNEVATGTITIDYHRQLDDLDLDPGAYPMELRVRTDAQGVVREWVIEEDLLIYDPEAPAVPVVLVVRVISTPSFDPEGRFVVDPGRFDYTRREMDALSGYILEHPEARLSLALPPLLAEEWAHIASGYEESYPEGITEIAADEPVPVAYAEMLARLKAAIGTGHLELMTVPYSDPDLANLKALGRLSDLPEQLTRGLSATLLSLETSPSPGAAFASDLIPYGALDSLMSRGIEHLIVSPDSLISEETTPSSGVYELVTNGTAGADGQSGSAIPRGLLLDPMATEAIATGTEGALLDAVFARSISAESTMPLVAIVEIGPGRSACVDSLRECAQTLETIPWVDMVTAKQAALLTPSGTLDLSPEPDTTQSAPGGYWAEIADSRSLSVAFLGAVGTNDPDAQAANDASLIAQSSAWSGPDESWNSADRALGFASSATRMSSAVLDGISITAQDITLSSAQGEIPVSLSNASEKSLLVTIRSRARGIALPDGSDLSLTARPQDTFFTVPVDLQSSLSGTLDIEVWAGDLLLDSHSVTIRASFLDRLALIGGVSIVLVGLLLFIRHRAQRTDTTGSID